MPTRVRGGRVSTRVRGTKFDKGGEALSFNIIKLSHTTAPLAAAPVGRSGLSLSERNGKLYLHPATQWIDIAPKTGPFAGLELKVTDTSPAYFDAQPLLSQLTGSL